MNKIETLKAVYEAATPGEWEHHWKLQWSVRHVSKHPYISGGRGNKPLSEEDAAFIAIAHNLMPSLLEASNALDMLVRAANTKNPDPLVMFASIEKAKHVLEKLK